MTTVLDPGLPLAECIRSPGSVSVGRIVFTENALGSDYLGDVRPGLGPVERGPQT